MSQARIFLNHEGDAWFERNRDQLGAVDPVTETARQLPINPTSVLEIGCANGWRLAKWRELWGCDIRGLEPSGKAIENALGSGMVIKRGTAEFLPFIQQQFDVVIFGFCLYLVDPIDYFRVASEADRVLRDRGWLIIHDFPPEAAPYARIYQHAQGVRAYHVDFAEFWLAHPYYQLASRAGFGDELVTALRKNMAAIQVSS